MTKLLPFAHSPGGGLTDEWLTPPAIIEALGPFDLDPCSPVNRPWDTAAKHFTEQDDGLSMPWSGAVWCNPPYSDIEPWMCKLARHGNGIALVFARTETQWFFRHVWGKASGIFFFEGRLTFHTVDGAKGRGNAGAPSVLISYGSECLARLERFSAPGRLVKL